MKKIISVLISFVIFLSLVACSQTDTSPDDANRQEAVLCGFDISPWITARVLNEDKENQWLAARTRINNPDIAGDKYLHGKWKTADSPMENTIKFLSQIKTESQPTEYNFSKDEICYKFSLITYADNNPVEYYISSDFKYIGAVQGIYGLTDWQLITFPDKVYKITNAEEILKLAKEYGIYMLTMAERSQITDAEGPCGVDISWWLDNFKNAKDTLKGRLHLKAEMNNMKEYETDPRRIGGKGKDVVKVADYISVVENFSTSDVISFDIDYFTKDDYFYYLNFYLTDLTRENLTDAPQEITFMFFNDFEYVVVSDIPRSVYNSEIKYVVSDIYKVSNPQQIKDCFIAEEVFIQ